MGWEVVGYSSDPVPDDPWVVAEQVQHLRNVATTIQTQLDRMPTDGNVDSLVWDSDAAAGFREVVKKLPKDLGTLKTRYERVASALDGFNTTLRACKADIAQGYADAQRVTADAASASNGVRTMQDHATQARSAADRANATAPPGTPPATPAPWTGPNYYAQLTVAQKALQDAKEKVDRAVGSFHDASRTAASAVNDANHDDLKNDTGFWHGLGEAVHWVTENLHLEALAGLLSKISFVAGVLAAVLAFVPFLQPLAAALEVVSLVAAGLTLACDLIVQADKAFQGTFSWGDFALTIGIDTAAVVLGSMAREAGGAATAAKGATAEARAATEVAATATGQAGRAVAVRELAVNLTTGGPVRRAVAAVGGRVLGTGNLGTLATTSLARSEQALGATVRAEEAARAVQAAREAAQATAERTAHGLTGASLSSSGAGVVNVVNHERQATALDQAAQSGGAIAPQPIR